MAPMFSNDTVRIAVIAIVSVMLAKALLPKVPGANVLAAYL